MPSDKKQSPGELRLNKGRNRPWRGGVYKQKMGETSNYAAVDLGGSVITSIHALLGFWLDGFQLRFIKLLDKVTEFRQIMGKSADISLSSVLERLRQMWDLEITHGCEWQNYGQKRRKEIRVHEHINVAHGLVVRFGNKFKSTKNDGSEHVGSGSSKADDDLIQEEKSLWSHFQRSKKDSLNKSQDDSEDESKVEEYPPYDATRISSTGEGLSMEDDLDCYDGYEAQVYNLSRKSQDFCDNYDIRVNSRVRK
ncbi:hypothetical protein Tco_0655955 [Tanacetum coccineum]|uniref:Uncharacterized protein n=1 Tax=Tanacetum coccineum TaxID=301880 RepID=A0ABQ4X8M9_9ASTR